MAGSAQTGRSAVTHAGVSGHPRGGERPCPRGGGSAIASTTISRFEGRSRLRLQRGRRPTGRAPRVWPRRRRSRPCSRLGSDHDTAIAIRMRTATTWMAVASGGALGSLARYLLGAVMTALTGQRFPWGTLLINVAGSFVIGLIAAATVAPGRVLMNPDLRIFLMVGLCGGFTTFSAFSLQTLELTQAGEIWPAAAYVVGSVVLCLAAVWLGWLAGQA